MAGPLLQAWGLGMGLGRGATLRSRAALRPLGLLAPPSRAVVGTGPRDGPGEAALEENPFYGKYRHKIQELRRWLGWGRNGGKTGAWRVWGRWGGVWWLWSVRGETRGRSKGAGGPCPEGARRPKSWVKLEPAIPLPSVLWGCTIPYMSGGCCLSALGHIRARRARLKVL